MQIHCSHKPNLKSTTRWCHRPQNNIKIMGDTPRRSPLIWWTNGECLRGTRQMANFTASLWAQLLNLTQNEACQWWCPWGHSLMFCYMITVLYYYSRSPSRWSWTIDEGFSYWLTLFFFLTMNGGIHVAAQSSSMKLTAWAPAVSIKAGHVFPLHYCL